MWVKVAKKKKTNKNQTRNSLGSSHATRPHNFPLRAWRLRVYKPVPPQRGYWEHWEALRVPDLPHSVCSELADWAEILPLCRTPGQSSKGSELSLCHSSLFDGISRQVEGEKSTHWWSWENPSPCMDRWHSGGFPVPCMDQIQLHLGRWNRKVPEYHSDIFWLLPYQKLCTSNPCWHW